MQNKQNPKCSGIILAGGQNKRLPGIKKTFRTVGDDKIIERISSVFSLLFDEVILVVNEPEAFSGLGLTLVTDIYPCRCSLAGVHAGLYYASNPYAYVTACDAPFVSYEIIKYMMGRITPDVDVIVPRSDWGLEPLSAIYSKDCIPQIEKNLENDIYKIRKFYQSKKVEEIPPKILKQLDPQMRFAYNINTPDDLITANLMVQEKRKIV